tara:strand:+ start:508 stop:1005 length:498 start_codon:yes stop_codon:yes gene_type:complete
MENKKKVKSQEDEINVSNAVKVLDTYGFTYHISKNEDLFVSHGIDPINSYIDTKYFNHLTEEDVYGIIEKFQKGKSDFIISSFDEIYQTIEETIGEGGICLYLYSDMLMEITGDKVEVFNHILRCLSNIYHINILDMTGSTTINEDMNEYTILEKDGLTLEFFKK